ncbi:CAS1 [Symbiodinium sp. KB8]|nr:CAS1 [Symbiodinium sp. KB8]
MDFTLEYIRAEDKQTNHVCIGPVRCFPPRLLGACPVSLTAAFVIAVPRQVNKVLNMLSCWFAHREENVKGNYTEEFRRHAVRMMDYLWAAEDGVKMQGYNGSQLWDTAFAAQVIPPLRKAFQYIKDTQIERNEENFRYWYRVVSKGTVAFYFALCIPFMTLPGVPLPPPGGWPFSTGDHGWPITDCSAEGLKVAVLMMKAAGVVPESELIPMHKLEDCVTVILNLQDGGWASYEDQRGGPWYEAFNPAEVFGDIMIDYSYVECSAACLNALKAFQSVNPNHRKAEIDEALHRGGEFIRSQQRPDGSFYGSWAVCMTYGTWFGVQGMLATGEAVNSSRMRRVAHYMMTKQRSDGGWGEDVRACATKQYEQIE